MIKLNPVKPLPQEYLLDALERTIEHFSYDPDKKPSKTFKPSSLQCSRRAYYQLVAMPQDVEGGMSSSLAGIVESGTDRHTRLQEWFMRIKELGYNVEYVMVEDFLKEFPNPDLEIVGYDGAETKLYNNRYNMSFMCDGIVKVNGEYYILEIKTESTFKFRYREDIAPEHIRQATAYHMNFKLPVIFIYENRDFLEKKAYLFNPQERHIEDVLKVMIEAEEGLKDYTTPAIPENIFEELDDWVERKKVTQKAIREDTWRDTLGTCRYCDYRERCKKEGHGKFKKISVKEEAESSPSE